jgi:hypothetical protein
MQKDLPPKLDSETLRQLAQEQLVEIIIDQAIAIEQLKSRVVELEIVIEKLKVSRDLDSTRSSKPPSGDILKRAKNFGGDRGHNAIRLPNVRSLRTRYLPIKDSVAWHQSHDLATHTC